MAPGTRSGPHLEQGIGEHLHQVAVAAGQFHDRGEAHDGQDDADEAGHGHALDEGLGPGLEVQRQDRHDQPAREQGQPDLDLPDDGGKRHGGHHQGNDVEEHRRAPFGPTGPVQEWEG